MKLSELASELKTKRLIQDGEITGLCTDSRTAEGGDLFFCFRGTHTDSHEFAEEAALKGAALVTERELPLEAPQLVVPDGRVAMAFLSAAFYGHPERSLRLVGVTGTNGKTTTCHFLHAIFSAAGRRAGLIGTLGAQYGGTVVPPDLTTPDPVSLFSLLADMKHAGVTDVAMEVSAHALALGKVDPIRFDAAIFTNLTRDHLDFFKDMSAYAAAKKKLFSPASCKLAVLNADDPFSSELLRCGAPAVTYGLDTPADSFAVIEEEGISGSRAVFNLSDELLEAQIALTGRYNVENALAAAAAAHALGCPPEAIAEGLGAVERVEGRLERVCSFRGAEIFVDFAHTPDGLEKSLSALKAHTAGKLVLVFGCGGNRDAGKREQMGETAARLADFTVITSDNPRFEDPCAIIAEIEKGYRRVSKDYVAVEEREKGIAYAVEKLKEGDVLLVAGKGGETYQEIMGIKFDYNDKAVIRSAVGKLS